MAFVQPTNVKATGGAAAAFGSCQITSIQNHTHEYDSHYLQRSSSHHNSNQNHNNPISSVTNHSSSNNNNIRMNIIPQSPPISPHYFNNSRHHQQQNNNNNNNMMMYASPVPNHMMITGMNNNYSNNAASPPLVYSASPPAHYQPNFHPLRDGGYVHHSMPPSLDIPLMEANNNNMSDDRSAVSSLKCGSIPFDPNAPEMPMDNRPPPMEIYIPTKKAINIGKDLSSDNTSNHSSAAGSAQKENGVPEWLRLDNNIVVPTTATHKKKTHERRKTTTEIPRPTFGATNRQTSCPNVAANNITKKQPLAPLNPAPVATAPPTIAAPEDSLVVNGKVVRAHRRNLSNMSVVTMDTCSLSFASSEGVLHNNSGRTKLRSLFFRNMDKKCVDLKRARGCLT